MRRVSVKTILRLAKDGALAINGIAQSVQDTAQQFFAHPDIQHALGGSHFTARTNALHLTDRHQHDIALTEPHHFGRDGRHIGIMGTYIT